MRADAMTFGEFATHEILMGGRVDADQEECRLDALILERPEHAIGRCRIRSIVEGQYDLVVLKG